VSRAGRSLLLCAAAGAIVVAGSRLALPFAPALYDGIAPVSPQPYRYVSPPPDLTAGNKPPLAIDSPLTFQGGTNLAHAVTTPDQQLLVSFNDGAIKVSGVSALQVHVGPISQPPEAPAGSTFVGNVYEAAITDYTPPGASATSPAGFALPPQPPISGSVQVLMRVPPVSYNNVRLYYDGRWHDITGDWGAQGDYVAVSPMRHLGLVAAFQDSSSPGKKPPSSSSAFPVVPVVVGITVATLLIIVAGVYAQLRRQPGRRPRR